MTITHFSNHIQPHNTILQYLTAGWTSKRENAMVDTPIFAPQAQIGLE